MTGLRGNGVRDGIGGLLTNEPSVRSAPTTSLLVCESGDAIRLLVPGRNGDLSPFLCPSGVTSVL